MANKEKIIAVLQILKKYNLKDTEEVLKKECNLTDEDLQNENLQTDSDVSSVLTAYKSERDPEVYESAYIDLRKFVEGSLDIYKHELGMILYPVLVHMYLELVYNGHSEKAVVLMQKFGPEQADYYQEDLKKLAQVTNKEHMKGNELTETFKSNEFVIRMSRDTLSLLKRHLHEKRAAVLLNIVQEHLYFDMYEGVARNKQQIESTSGAILGEATRQANKTKIYYGIPKEPDIQLIMSSQAEEDEDADPDAPDKPKKKKVRRDPLFSKKTKSDPNAPHLDRIPLPELKDRDKLEKIKAMRESLRRVNLSAETLPSACFYTLLNSVNTITCADISEDSSLLVAGFSESMVKVWSLGPTRLKGMKSAEQLHLIDRDAEDVLVRMMDVRTGSTCRTLFGHSGPVYRVVISLDRTLILSCSEDGTVRLWSTHTWTCVVCYKGHIYPVWDVKFSPHGYYFVTGSHDKTARLWATDQHQPLHIFAGHYSDVDAVQFHPNSNYVATGSSDRTVCLWDCLNGNQVRLMTGHKGSIHSLAFSVEGKFLASAGSDKRILIWDLAHGHLVAELCSHTAPVHSLTFSRCGNILASGALDCTLKLWDFAKLLEETNSEDVNVSHNPDVRSGDNYLLRSFPTKNSPLLCLHFTRRNLLLAVGMYEPS